MSRRRVVIFGDFARDVNGISVEVDVEQEARWRTQVDRAVDGRLKALGDEWVSPFLAPPSVRAVTA